MKKEQEFLLNLITTIPKSTNDALNHYQKSIKFEGLEKTLYKIITRSYFRSGAVKPEFAQKIEEKVRFCVTKKLPIHFSVPFGGFKKWQLPSYPNIDWSEIFNFLWLREYSNLICEVYEPGVILEYFSDEIFISRMNNMPQSDLDTYNDQFKQTLSSLSSYLPANFSIKYSYIRDQISQEEILKHFDVAIEKLKTDWEGLPVYEKEKRLKKSERNYKTEGNVIDSTQKNKLLFESTLVHDAFIFSSEWEKNVPWAFDKDMIPIGFRYTGTWGLPLKSSRNSAVQFWVGVGALTKKGDEYIPTILTYEQFRNSKNIKKVNVDVLDFTPREIYVM